MIKPEPLGLITHNRIYMCIGVSPCPVIVDLVIIGSVASPCDVISRHGIVSPAITSTLSRPAKGRPPLWSPPPPLLAAGLAAGNRTLQPGGERHSHLLLAAVTAALAAAGRPCKGAGHGLPLLQGVWQWSAALIEGLAMSDLPLSSLPSLRKHSKNTGREENRRGRLELQPINHESPLLFIESHHKTLGFLP
ncbi:hypothetical protein GW17_00036282 [Ensete ventricosum]|nr:hypothetical protein GW17_00036282 [Ensete ventricosum]RZS01402.1 hypothetical protein BHM03_00031245 [Ensete ventricosum]